ARRRLLGRERPQGGLRLRGTALLFVRRRGRGADLRLEHLQGLEDRAFVAAQPSERRLRLAQPRLDRPGRLRLRRGGQEGTQRQKPPHRSSLPKAKTVAVTPSSIPARTRAREASGAVRR